MRSITAVAALSLVSACQQKPEENTVNAVTQTSTSLANDIANSAATDEPASLAEPEGPVDPKSAEAAGQVVQHFAALIERNRYAEAGKLWSDATAAAAFTEDLHPSTHTQIGELGQLEVRLGQSTRRCQWFFTATPSDAEPR